MWPRPPSECGPSDWISNVFSMGLGYVRILELSTCDWTMSKQALFTCINKIKYSQQRAAVIGNSTYSQIAD